MSIDRLTSSFSGRPCGLQDEECVCCSLVFFGERDQLCSANSFDLDLPIECDDEFWETPNEEDRFTQPAGTPSCIAFFNCYLSLMDILAYAMRAIVCFPYSICVFVPSASAISSIVCDQAAKEYVREGFPTYRTANYRRVRFSNEQLDGFCSSTS